MTHTEPLNLAPRKGRPCKIQKEDLLDTGEELFAKHGFDGTSVRMLAAKAHCNLALISYYFGSKEGLYEAILLRHFERASHQIERNEQALIQQWPEFKTPVERRLASMLFGIAITMLDHPQMQKIICQEMITGSKRMVSALIKTEKSGTQELRRELDSLISSRIFKKIDPRLALLTLLAPLIYSLMATPVIKNVYGFKQIDEIYMRELCAHLIRTVIPSWLEQAPALTL